MDKFKFTVVLEIEVEAFDYTDALDAIQDTFGIGEDAGINVTQCEYQLKKQ